VGQRAAPYGPFFLFIRTTEPGQRPHELWTVLGTSFLETVAVACCVRDLIRARTPPRPRGAFVLSCDESSELTLIGGDMRHHAGFLVVALPGGQDIRLAFFFCSCAAAIKAAAMTGVRGWRVGSERYRDRVETNRSASVDRGRTLGGGRAGVRFCWVEPVSNGHRAIVGRAATGVGLALTKPCTPRVSRISVGSVFRNATTCLLTGLAHAVAALARRESWLGPSLALSLILSVETRTVVQPWYLAGDLVCSPPATRPRALVVLALSITGPFILDYPGTPTVIGLAGLEPLLMRSP